MCTVTFVPTKNGFIFTSNRDEDPQRAASKLIEEKRGEHTITFPQDQGAKGTWFAFSNRQQFVCVLNGAFEPHIRKSSYSMSRG
ncbi:MAG: NRDE family protein, partial [Flavobacteriaceae bacterium]